MGNTVTAFNGLEIFFLICAVIGSTFVLFKLIMQFIGGDADSDLDGGGGPDDIDLGDHHVDSDVGFRFLSLHGFSAFLMMFGLVGLAISRQSGGGVTFSLPGAIVAGLAAVWLIGKLFQGAARLQSSGTISNTAFVGCTGTVYLTIPATGTGRVNISHRGRLREMDAEAANGQTIPTGTAIKVSAVKGRMLVVEPLA